MKHEMNEHRPWPPSIQEVIQVRLGDRLAEYLIPPPVLLTMRGELVAFDPEDGMLTTRFPVLEKYRNPYGAMQGGMLAAPVDNTIGPLSLLVAPPSVTRRLEMKYSRPATPEVGYITIQGTFVGRQERRLKFRAEVRDPLGEVLAKAQAIHWIVDLEGLP